MVTRLPLVCFGLLLSVVPVNAQQICSGLLTYASRDELDYDRDTATAQTLYREHCEGSTARRASATNVGLEAVIKAIPIKFSLGTGNSSERINQFCKLATDQNLLNEKVNLKRSAVVREALDAFNRCIQFSGQEVFFDPIICSRDLNVSVRRGTQNVTFKGVEHDDSLSCKIFKPANATKDGIEVRIDDSTTLPIYCTRVGRKLTTGSVQYLDTALTILTDRGNFRVPVPADADLPLDSALEIAAQISEVGSRLTTLESRFNNTRIECLSTSASVVQGRNQDGVVVPPLTVYVPEQFRSSHVIVGGSCDISKWYQDRVASLGGGKTQDNFGWHCRAGDPPGLPRVYDMTATVHYCRMAKP